MTMNAPQVKDLAMEFNELQNRYDVVNSVSRDFLLAFFVMATTFRSYKLQETVFHCDFESGMCPGFSISSKSDIPWQVHSGETPTNDTGPSGDHTRFNKDGKYVYLEASNRRFGETAVLLTTPVYMLEHESYCLSFWLNLYGHGTGSVHIYRPVGPYISKKHTIIFALVGQKSDNGSDWKFFQVNLPKSSFFGWNKPVRFEIRGVRGFSYTSDIAIDDIMLTVGKCIIVNPKPVGTTAYFGTTRPTQAATTVAWQARDPRFMKCGQNYWRKDAYKCCKGVAVKGTTSHKCCPNSTQIYKPLYQACCGGATMYWTGTQGCCADKFVFRKLSSQCVDGKVVNKPSK